MKTLWMATLAIAFAALIGSEAAYAEKMTRASFCGGWQGVCNRTCPQGRGQCKPECTRRYNACLADRSGCYFFNSPGPRCMNNADDVKRWEAGAPRRAAARERRNAR